MPTVVGFQVVLFIPYCVPKLLENIGNDLDPNCFDILIVLLKEYFKKCN